MVSLLRRNKAATDQPHAAPAGEEVAAKELKPPFLLRLRSSTAFIAFTVGFGVLVDLSSYAIIVPVIPFRLQALGYAEDRVGSLTGWLVAAYAGGLIVSSPPAAWIGAKWDNRQIPLVGGLLFMAGAIVLFMETHVYAAMVVARILQGFSGTTLWTIGLALVTDSVPEYRVGAVLGQVMIGFSLGQAIGPPVGGTMYARLGYRAPFIFSLILVGVDLLLRLCIIEKHQALRWIERGAEIEGFEAPGYEDSKQKGEKEKAVEGEGEKRVEEGAVPPTPIAADALSERTRVEEDAATVHVPLADATPKDVEGVGAAERELEQEVAASPEVAKKVSRIPDEFLGFYLLCKSPRAMTSIYLTFINGFIVGSALDTAMTIYLETKYGLSSLGAGLVFLGVVIPTFFVSPLAGWITDKYGTKWIMTVGIALCIPVYPLLIIEGPLALFVFFLVLVGIGVACFLTPVTVDLAICASEAAGLQTAHVFGTFNLSFSIGSFIGPIIGGQIINATGIRKAWIILCAISSALSAVSVPPIVLYVGGRLGRKKDAVEGARSELSSSRLVFITSPHLNLNDSLKMARTKTKSASSPKSDNGMNPKVSAWHAFYAKEAARIRAEKPGTKGTTIRKRCSVAYKKLTPKERDALVLQDQNVGGSGGSDGGDGGVSNKMDSDEADEEEQEESQVE
ncbi:hypothetical protein JCM8097_006605 [Rhodosporidiobolus ruineniae]